MSQGLEFKDMIFAVKGKGRISDECENGFTNNDSDRNVERGVFPVVPVPKLMRNSIKIGTVFYDVTASFSPNGSRSVFSQFLDMILDSQN